MRRPSPATLILLVCAALVNVAVAWIIALSASDLFQTMVKHQAWVTRKRIDALSTVFPDFNTRQ